MIGFYTQVGGPLQAAYIHNLLFHEYNLANQYKTLKAESYSSELSLILIQLYIEGEICYLGPEKLTVGRYSSKDKSIAIKMPIKKAATHGLSEKELVGFIFAQMNEGLEICKKRLYKTTIAVNWDLLEIDNLQIQAKMLAN